MGLNFEAEMRGADKLLRDLNEVTTIIAKAAPEELMAMGEDIVEVMQEYPPESEANQPPPPYYIRGTGQIGRGGNLTKSSENLREQWTVTPEREGQEVSAVVVRNTVTYAGWVHGMFLQTAFHARRGWKRLGDVGRQAVTGGGTINVTLYDRGLKILKQVKQSFR